MNQTPKFLIKNLFHLISLVAILFLSPKVALSVTQNIQPPQASLDKYESLLFVQNTDPVQVQSFPCLIDLKDQFIIQRASCGSRHTALLTGNFSL